MKTASLWFFFFGVPTDGSVTGTVDVSAAPPAFSGAGNVVRPEQSSSGAAQWSVRGARTIIRPKPTTGRVWGTLDVGSAAASVTASGDVARQEITGCASMDATTAAGFIARGDVQYSDDDEVMLIDAA